MHTNVTRLAILGGAAALVAAATLAGCAAANSAPADATSPSAAPTGGQGQERGGLTGEVVQLGSGYFLAQGDDMQTTVTYDASTTFTNQVSGSLADVAVGSCISAFGTPSADGSDSAAVTTVTVSQPVDGECAIGFGGGGQSAQGDAPSGGDAAGGRFSGGAPSGAPGGAPSGGPEGSFPGGSGTLAPGGEGLRVAGAFGKVTAVSGDTITVESTMPAAAAGGGEAASAAPSSSTTTVTVDASTTYRVEQAADASALAVGLCVTARGTADTSGGYAATSVALSPKGDDGCSTGAGRGQIRTGGSGRTGSGTTTGQQG